MATNSDSRGELDRAAIVLWDYHRMQMAVPARADLLLVGGSHDTRVAERAAALVSEGDYSYVVVSGGAGKITNEVFSSTEAAVLRDVMQRCEIDVEKVILEEKASNAGENITFTRDLLSALHANVATGLLVAKPYMERRFFATASRQWHDVRWSVTSPGMPYHEYSSEDVPKQRMIELMVGDLQRIELYAERGLQIPQEIPSEVRAAYNYLVDLGFDAQVIKAT